MHDVVDYRCTSCGFRSKAAVSVRGRAEIDAWPSRQASELAALAAEIDAHRAIEEAVGLASCPSCRKRDGAARRRALWRRFGMSFGAGVVASIGGLFVAGKLDANPLVGMAIAAVAVTALVWPLRYRRALAHADRIELVSQS